MPERPLSPSRERGVAPYADRDWFDRLHDEAAERGERLGPRPSQREMVAASLLADDGRASHHQTYPLRPARPGPSKGTAAETSSHRMVAGAPIPTAPVPELMTGAGEPSNQTNAAPPVAPGEAA